MVAISYPWEVTAMPECRLMDCHLPADRCVSHPYRPEERTPLCADHAATAAESIEAVEVVARV